MQKTSLATVGLLALLAVGEASAAGLDPEATVGPKTCEGCHRAEYDQWQGTAHAALFESDLPLHTRPRAQQISRNLGIRLIKHDSRCLDCHYTPKRRSGKVTAIAGVSCESCHGAATSWVGVHSSFKRRAVETPEERESRVAGVSALGMFMGGRVYDLVSRCYDCHLVDDEWLVEEGQHSAGSSFDLVSRLDAVRHNFVTGERYRNAAIGSEKRRLFYVLGLALELEHNLRSLAKTEEENPYARTRARRAQAAAKNLQKVQRLVSLPALAKMTKAVDGLRLEVGNGSRVEAAAEKVSKAARALAEEHDGSRLTVIDRLLRGRSRRAPPRSTEPEVDKPTSTTSTTSTPSPTGPRPSPTEPSPPPTTETPPAAPPSTPGPRILAHLRPPLSSRDTVGCEGCHSKERKIVSRHSHETAAEPFLGQSSRQQQIVNAYYTEVATHLLATGRGVCMDCHGTVLSDFEDEQVEFGVSCESCHGPAGDYLGTHMGSELAQRTADGMVDLSNAKRRAKVCASCHYINNSRLLASGHPSGRGFDIVQGVQAIAHWESSQPSAEHLRQAWRAVLGARGPVPEVLEVDVSTTNGSPPPPPTKPTPGPPPPVDPRTTDGPTPTPPPILKPPEPAAKDPFSTKITIDDVGAWSLEEILFWVKERLQTLREEELGESP